MPRNTTSKGFSRKVINKKTIDNLLAENQSLKINQNMEDIADDLFKEIESEMTSTDLLNLNIDVKEMFSSDYN